MIDTGLAVAGVVLSCLVYMTSIAKPPPASPEESAKYKPYHDVDAGGYHKTKWWYEEEENEVLVQGKDPTVKNHVALVTGGNSGIGRAVALELCKLGVGTVVITSRSQKRGQAAAQEMIADGSCQSNQIHSMELDLADFDNVRAFATDFLEKHDRLNYFVENAGGIIIPGSYSGPYRNKEGIESLYAGNYLGHFLLLNLLLEVVESSSPSRISLTSSIANWGATENVTSLLPVAGSDARKSQEENDSLAAPFQQYSNTKFLQVAMAFELQRRLNDSGSRITITPTAPGFINTDIGSMDRDKKPGLVPPIARNPKAGAETTLHALFSKSMEGKQGYFVQPYWSPLHQSPPPGLLGFFSVLLWEPLFQRVTWGCHLWLPNPRAHDREFQKQLWEESLE
ncbi:MAG: hypothetical protein SGILL_008378, partial [Bacillariaceae sp.]